MHNNFFLGFLCVLTMTLCSVPAKKNSTDAQAGDSNSATGLSSAATESAAQTSNAGNGIYGVWGGGDIDSTSISKYPFFKGWYIRAFWKQLEPEKDRFDWSFLDAQFKFAADHNLAIGFMVWVGPLSPEWLYSNGVPKVITDTKKKEATYPFYLNPYYKERYLNMLKQVAAHIEKLPAEERKKIVMWMSTEGSTGDIVPYKGRPQDSQYDISQDQWTNFKRDVWTYMYKVCQNATPRINLLVNQGNDGRYFDWLHSNLLNVWMKAGNISHTYQFNGELEYYNRLQKLEVKTREDSSANRTRGEITVSGKWFNQNESWNMYALLGSCLHFGLDIFNTAPKYLNNPIDSISFNFFNVYAGQKVAATAPGAFCLLRDGLDAADLKRFPESKYGPVIDPAKLDQYNKEMQRKGFSDDDGEEDGGSDEGIKQSDIKNDNLSAERINKILEEYAAYGAKRGDLSNLDDVNADSSSYNPPNATLNKKGKVRNPDRQSKNQNRKNKKSNDGGKKTSYQKEREANMVINDIGVNLVPDNYYRYLIQYSPNTTSRGYWRVGPTDQPYGRFARGFDSKKDMTEMFFALDKKFFNGSTTAQKVIVKVIYLDKGTGAWSLNYSAGNNKKEAYKISCTNSGRWITKTIFLTDAVFTQKVDHSCDLSIKYLSGDNTIFNSIEVLRQ